MDNASTPCDFFKFFNRFLQTQCQMKCLDEFSRIHEKKIPRKNEIMYLVWCHQWRHRYKISARSPFFFSNSFHKLDVNWKVLMFSKGPVKSIRWLIRATTSIACHQNGLIVACTQGWSLTTTPCDPLWECTTSKQKEIFSNGFRHLTCKRCENDYMKGFFSASSQFFFILKKPSGVPKNGHPCPSEG